MRLLLVAIAAIALVVACSDDDEDMPGDEDVASIDVPTDWPEFAHPEGLYSLRYPPDWYQVGDAVYSFDPSEAEGSKFPDGETKVEVGYYPAKGSTACGPLSIDPETGTVTSIEPGATETTLGGEPAWRIVRSPPEVDADRIHGIALIHGTLCMSITAYYLDETPDEETFSQIVSKFEFGT
jgi:hypothetical protein